jgi:general secretion pathway protein B
MSSILDALKKSERQRSLGRELIFRHTSPDAAPRLTGFAIAVLITLLMLIVAIGALLLSLRAPESPETALPVEAFTPPADSKTGTTQASSDTAAASVPLIAADATRRADNKLASGSGTAPVLSKAIAPIPAKPVDVSRKPVPALPVPGNGEAPWLSILPQAFRSSLPLLAVNIHVYSPDQSKRILYINNRPVQQGERIEGGVLVEEIVHDGVVLQYRGQRFKLPRPS